MATLPYVRRFSLAPPRAQTSPPDSSCVTKRERTPKQWLGPSSSRQSKVDAIRALRLEMNADFFLLSVHRYFAAPGTWFAFESTPRVPASAALMDGGLHNWTDGRAIEAQFLVEEQCEGLKSNQSRSEWHTNDSAVEAHCRHGAAICTSACARQWGRSVGKFPVTGTGLAYQNGCASVGVPFALRWWLGEGEAALAPSCAELRARIRPSPDSEAAPEDCSDAA